jgi:hypothetical protein
LLFARDTTIQIGDDIVLGIDTSDDFIISLTFASHPEVGLADGLLFVLLYQLSARGGPSVGTLNCSALAG